MAEKRQKKQAEGSGGAPKWMTTFSDLMSLLLCFFVLIVSFSSVEMIKFQKALGSLKGALGVMPRETTVFKQWDPIIPQLSDMQKKRVQKVVSELRNISKKQGSKQDITLEASKDGILIRIDSPVLYNSGEAELKESAFPILNKIVDMTQEWPNRIRIEGHTDNIPISNMRFPSNWELSSARALTVLRFFVERGKIEPKRLAAVGYGEYHPLLPNTTPENRSKNRRVEIYIERSNDENLSNAQTL